MIKIALLGCGLPPVLTAIRPFSAVVAFTTLFFGVDDAPEPATIRMDESAQNSISTKISDVGGYTGFDSFKALEHDLNRH